MRGRALAWEAQTCVAHGVPGLSGDFWVDIPPGKQEKREADGGCEFGSALYLFLVRNLKRYVCKFTSMSCGWW